MSAFATPGTTSIGEVLGFEERLTRLERENAQLRDMLREQAYCISVLHDGLGQMRHTLRLGDQVSQSHSSRLTRLEASHQGDLRLSEILGDIEARLDRVEGVQR